MTPQQRVWSLVVAVCAPFLAAYGGCGGQGYHLVLRPEGDGLVRTLTVEGTRWDWIVAGRVKAQASWQRWSKGPAYVAGRLQYGDGTGGNLLGCSAFTASSLKRKIVLLDRGSCAISIKASNVGAAGGLAAIVANNQPQGLGERPSDFAYGGGTPSVAVYRITRADGRALKAVLGKMATIDPATATGAKEEGELVQRLRRLYPETRRQPPGGPASSWTFSGAFLSEMPADFDGAGRFRVLRTSLGSVSAWVERFRGDPDQATAVRRSLEAAGRICESLGGWLEWQLGDHPGAAQLREFVSSRVRNDLENLILITWANEGTLNRPTASTDPSEAPARALLYLSERGYFDPADVPRLALAVQRALGDNDETELWGFAQRMVARALGLRPGEPLPEKLDCLSDRGRANASFAAYLVAQAGGDTADPETALSRGQALEAWYREASGLGKLLPLRMCMFGCDHDFLSVRLLLPARPTGTNGTWSERSKVLEWRHLPLPDVSSEKPSSDGLPMLLYAWWAEPDEGFQRAHLGRVAVSGEALATYVMWRVSLDASTGEEWEAFLGGLSPGPELAPRISSFRFAKKGPTGEDRPENLADTARNLILEGLPKKAPRTKARP
jgi:hypothetical protein